MAELRQRKTEEEKGEDAGAVPKPPPTTGSKPKPKRIPLDRKAEAERWTRLMLGAAEKAPSSVTPYIKQAAPIIAQGLVLFQLALPMIVTVIGAADRFFKVLPVHLFEAIIGFLMCFFGGMYPATIAATEAWQQAGGKRAILNCKALYNEFQVVMKKSEEDDARDDDGDGIADVDQISVDQLLARKMHLALTTCNPDNLNSAIQGLYTGWIGVVAVLKIQFAKTIALGAAIGDFINPPATRVVGPVLELLIPKDYHHWIPSLISYACKSFAISIAWYIQRIISAFHSAIKGGLMCSRGLLNYLNKIGRISFNDEESYIDEVVGWSLAALGFYFQFRMGFAVPFPLNLVLWPFSMCEWYIVWTISS